MCVSITKRCTDCFLAAENRKLLKEVKEFQSPNGVQIALEIAYHNELYYNQFQSPNGVQIALKGTSDNACA